MGNLNIDWILEVLVSSARWSIFRWNNTVSEIHFKLVKQKIEVWWLNEIGCWHMGVITVVLLCIFVNFNNWMELLKEAMVFLFVLQKFLFSNKNLFDSESLLIAIKTFQRLSDKNRIQ